MKARNLFFDGGPNQGNRAAKRALLGASALVFVLSLAAFLPAAQAGVTSAGSMLAAGPVSELAAPVAAFSPAPFLAPPSDPVPPQVLASVNVGSAPGMAVYDSGNGYVYEANLISNNVSILSGTSLVASVSLNSGNATVGSPTHLAYDPANGYVYVVDRYSFESTGGAVSVLSGASLLTTVNVGLLPVADAYDAADGYVYVTLSGAHGVALISGTSVLTNLSLAPKSAPGAIAYDPVNGYVYVANHGTDNVTAVDGTTIVGSTAVGVQPDALVVDPSTGAVYVANNGSGNVTLVQGTTPVGSVLTGTNPAFGAYDPTNGYVYIANRNSSDLTVLNGGSPVGSVPTASDPEWVAFDGGTDLVYAVDFGGNAVTVVDGTSVVGNVGLGNGPTAAVWDAVDDYVYVTNANSHNVSVVAIAYPVTFNETGLAAGSSWSVSFGSSTLSSTGTSIAFGVLPGTRPYSIAGPSGYRLVSSLPASPVVVTNAPVSVAVTFAPVSTATYDLTFVETGLTSMCGRSTEWSVTVGNTTQSSTSNSIVFVEPNGTYNYSVAGPQGVSVVSESPASPVTIAGAAVTVNITFGRGMPSPSTFSVTFQESGLPWGTTWCVTLGSTACSSSSDIRFSGLSSGTYSFSVAPVAGYTANPSSGTVTLHYRDAVVRIQFSGPGSHHCGGWDPATGAYAAARLE